MDNCRYLSIKMTIIEMFINLIISYIFETDQWLIIVKRDCRIEPCIKMTF